MWLGVDDTDSPTGGCTTWVVSEILREAFDAGLDIQGYPRLVRLNPNVPFKTRGNAALALHLVHGTGPRHPVGIWGGETVRAFLRGRPLSGGEFEAFLGRVLRVLRREARWGEPGTDPALAWAPRLLPSELYWSAVRTEVTPQQAIECLGNVPGSGYVSYESGAGIVGAAAAIAWPGQRRTWEVISYRKRSRWGTPRSVSAESVQKMADQYPETFLSWDEKHHRLLVTPHTPCPILFGVRGRAPRRLLDASCSVESEAVDRRVLFVSNQATGDHVQYLPISQVAPGMTPALSGAIASAPLSLRGGHVRFSLKDDTGEIPCLAFEPGKDLVGVVRELVPGDEISVWGSVPWGAKDRVLRLEGIQVRSLRSHMLKRKNPVCPTCTRSANSMGRGKGYRCRSCRARFPPEAAEGSAVDRSHLLGIHLPAESARRHLAALPGDTRFRLAVLRPSHRLREDGSG